MELRIRWGDEGGLKGIDKRVGSWGKKKKVKEKK
jgi:hypothetical protein